MQAEIATGSEAHINHLNNIAMSDNLIEGYTEQELLRCADHDVAEKTKESVVFDQAAEDRIPRFQISGKKVLVTW